MKLKIIQFFALFLLMLMTGVFWGTWFSLSRSMHVLSSDEFLHIGKIMIANLGLPMSIIMPSGILLMLASFWVYPDKKSIESYFGVAAFVLIVIALIVTLAIEVPIDNQVAEWTPSTIPSNWESFRDRFEFFHTVRTFMSLASFGLFSAFVIGTQKGKK